jgi:hypothetical protein
VTAASLEPVRPDRATSQRVPRVLLVSPVAPVPEGVGGVFLRDLCLMYPPDSLAFAILPGIGSGPWPERLASCPRTTLDLVPERGFNRWGRRVQRSTRGLFDRYVDRVHFPRLIDRVASFAERVRPDVLWVPLAGPTMINVAASLAERLDIPLLTMVWDPPDYFLPHYWQISGAGLDRVMTRFEAALQRSVRCAVASPEMKTAYEHRYGTPCVPMIHGLPESTWVAPSGPRPPNEPFVIGYAGSLYARREWDALLAALDSVAWRLAGRDVSLRVLGGTFEAKAAGPARIEYLGWHSTASGVRILSDCDVCYVPYWFDRTCRAGVELCFPNKISMYLAAGRPILFHGPRESTPAHFLDRHAVGIACHSLEPPAIVSALSSAAADTSFHEAAAREIPNALREELSLHVFRQRFADFIGLDQSVLAPVPD